MANEQAKLTSFLRKQDINAVCRTNNNIGRFIKNNKEKTSNINKSGVYKLNCGTCTKEYIGQTGRSFKKRISGHLFAYTKQKTDSAYANHLIEHNHKFNEQFEILHVNNKSKRLDFLESLEINKRKYSDNLLNDKVDLNNSPLLNLF